MIGIPLLGLALLLPASSFERETKDFAFPDRLAFAGPPAVCFPLDIGKAKSLPWGENGWDGQKGYALTQVIPDTLVILEKSSEPIVHMETLRRACLYLARSIDNRLGDALAHQLLSHLKSRVLETLWSKSKLSQHQQALIWLDLGYAQGVFSQYGKGPQENPAGALAKAAALNPQDGAIRLGVALAGWDLRQPFDNPPRVHLLAAAKAAGKDQPLLRRNLLATAGALLGTDSYDELLAKLSRSE